MAASVLDNFASGGPLPIVLAGGTMIAIALLAAYVPVRRATRIEPVIALRSE